MLIEQALARQQGLVLIQSLQTAELKEQLVLVQQIVELMQQYIVAIHLIVPVVVGKLVGPAQRFAQAVDLVVVVEAEVAELMIVVEAGVEVVG